MKEELTLQELEHAYYEYSKQLKLLEIEHQKTVNMINEISSKIEINKIAEIEKNKISQQKKENIKTKE